jgi:hypothetical protein
VVLGLAAGFARASVAGAQPAAHVRSDHWAYEALHGLAAHGLAPLWAASARPLTRLELAEMIRDVIAIVGSERRRFPPSALETLDRLAIEFADELARLGLRVTGAPGTVAGTEPAGVRLHKVLVARIVEGTPGRDVPAGARQGGVGLGLVWGGDRTALTIEGVWRLGADTTGVALDRAFVGGARDGLTMQVGRDALWWGPGGRGAFLLSDNAGPLDFARASYTRGTVRYSKMVASLGDGRLLYGTRVDILARPWLRIGLGEAIVAGGSFYPLYVLNPIPIVANYGLSLWDRARGQGQNDNYLFAIDVDWLVRPGVLVYGEALLDDLAFDGDLPHRIGGTVGVLLADPLRNGRTSLRLEFAAVTNWVYATPEGQNAYVRRGRVLGHWMAPDAVLLSVVATHQLRPGASVQLVFERLRKGEGQLGQLWTNPSEAWSRAFLSGVVEVTDTWQVRYRWMDSPQTAHVVGVSWSSIANAGHQIGQRRQTLWVWWDARFAL